ncbi:hypothetical protein C8T65DRAFT_838380 [Cerioporus squamosus]|nr:hypothetical protein C8T65DRAFT_838380 [Cerioporus squamosus]
MSPSDVPGPTASVTPARCTVHVFKGSTVLGITPQRGIVKSGSPVRITDSDWPPPVLFDATYASLVLKTFGVQATVDVIKEVWQDQLKIDVTATEKARRERRKYDRRAERARLASSKLDALDILSLIPYLAIPPGRVREYWAAERAKWELEEQRQSEAKVAEWRDRCADAGL